MLYRYRERDTEGSDPDRFEGDTGGRQETHGHVLHPASRGRYYDDTHRRGEEGARLRRHRADGRTDGHAHGTPQRTCQVMLSLGENV